MFPHQPTYTAFTISGDAAANDTIRRGFQWLADPKTPGQAALLLLPQKGQLEGTAVGAVLGPVRVKDLKAGRTIAIGSRSLFFATKLTLRRSDWPGGLVFAVWTDDEMLDALHVRRGVTAICAVPWLPQDIARWSRVMNPVDLRAEQPNLPAPISLPPPVLEALREVTSRTNLETGLAHPADHDSAVEAFSLLRGAGFSWNAEDVQVWALQNGWRPRGAEELAEIAKKIAAGSRLPRQLSRWSADALARWQQGGSPEVRDTE